MEYTHLLKEKMFPELRRIFIGAGKNLFFFQQDGAPIHTSAATSYLISKENVRTIAWPPNSPDLNIIENMWSIVQARVNKRVINNFEDFKVALEEEWNAVPLHEIRRLFDCIPNRLKQVID